MFHRKHHQDIHQVLLALDASKLSECHCFFGGGTAISLLLGEYRESIDIDLLCSNGDGFREIRSLAIEGNLSEILSKHIELVRDVKADRYGIRAMLKVNESIIKFEIVREARINLSGEFHPTLPIKCLSKEDMFAEKLLANADRWMDKSVLSRDIIDLAMMQQRWGGIPENAWEKATDAYGKSIVEAYTNAQNLLREPNYFQKCITTMAIDPDTEESLKSQFRVPELSSIDLDEPRDTPR
jgi:predicted nucleotidyltransferase